MDARIEQSAVEYWRSVLKTVGDNPASIPGYFRPNRHEQNSDPCNADLRSFVLALESLASSSRDRALSWNAGLGARYEVGGAAAPYILNSNTLGEALQKLCAACPALQDSTLIRLTVDGGIASLDYKILDPDIWPRHEDALFSLALYARLLKTAAPGAWNDVAIRLEIEREFAAADIGKIIRTNVSYGHPTNAIVFPATLLDLPLGCNDWLFDKPASVEPPVMSVNSRSLSDQVQEILFSEFESFPLSEQDVARRLNTSDRSLRRRLNQEGETFRDIVDECRMRQARLEMKRLRSESLAQIAMRVGYSDQANFTRAFVRWAGVSPRKFRNAHDHGKSSAH